MNKIPTASLLCCAFVAAALAGCAQLPLFGDGKRTPQRRADAPARDQAALREGIRLYNEGDFDGAIRRLGSKDIARGSTATRLAALKYTAFSYCVTERTEQCRQSFDKALKLDPSFDLAQGERGHPQWGPVFSDAKRD